MKYIISAKFNYGPYRTKSDAMSIIKQLNQIKATTTKITKVSRGYKFSAVLKYKAENAADKSMAIKQIKTNSPNATISVRRTN
ncbi:MAG: hypothetical protein M0R51_08235 [Clostridia bacterium]|jgi:hypothetical protein|nr:hypothetical protein [Clostridia bacterium]